MDPSSTPIRLLAVVAPVLTITAVLLTWPATKTGDRPRGRRAVVVWSLLGLALTCLVLRMVLKQD